MSISLQEMALLLAEMSNQAKADYLLGDQEGWRILIDECWFRQARFHHLLLALTDEYTNDTNNILRQIGTETTNPQYPNEIEAELNLWNSKFAWMQFLAKYAFVCACCGATDWNGDWKVPEAVFNVGSSDFGCPVKPPKPTCYCYPGHHHFHDPLSVKYPFD